MVLLQVLPVHFTLGAVPASDPAGTLTFAVVVDNPLPTGVTEINNAVTIADDGANGDDPTPDNNSDDELTPVGAAPDMTISKVDDVADTTSTRCNNYLHPDLRQCR